MAESGGQWTVGSLLDTAAGYLREKGSTSPRLDAELLLAETLGMERIHLYTGYDRPLSAGEVDSYRVLVGRRAGHEPIAYILGGAHFRHLRLEVTPDVLIPRPETEELVEAALESLARRPPFALPGSIGAEAPTQGQGSTQGPTQPLVSEAPLPLIADIGTGSGAIALSLAAESGHRVVATDTSVAALEVAARNRAAAGLDDRVDLMEADLLTGISAGSLHLIVSNPPYVSAADMETLAPDIRLFEPVVALEAGPDGLAVYRRLLPEAARALRPGGSVVMEVGDGQAAAVAGLAAEAGFALTEVTRDMSRKERMVSATMPGTVVAEPGDLSDEHLEALRAALVRGAVIGVPTDTVYGLAAGWGSQAGIDRLFAAKGRAAGQPVAVLFPSASAIETSLPDLDEASARVLQALLPGPFTFVVATSIPRPIPVGTEDSLGVRVPDHPGLLEFLARLSMPLAATSANRSGRAEAATLPEVDPEILGHCSLALQTASVSAGGTASTVVDLRPLATGGHAQVLREGTVPESEVLRLLGTIA